MMPIRIAMRIQEYLTEFLSPRNRDKCKCFCAQLRDYCSLVCHGAVCSVLVVLFCNGVSAHDFKSLCVDWKLMTLMIYRLLSLFIVYIVLLSFSVIRVHCMILLYVAV